MTGIRRITMPGQVIAHYLLTIRQGGTATFTQHLTVGIRFCLTIGNDFTSNPFIDWGGCNIIFRCLWGDAIAEINL